MKKYLGLLLVLVMGACGEEERTEASQGFEKIAARKFEKTKADSEDPSSFSSKCEGSMLLPMAIPKSSDFLEPIQQYKAISTHSFTPPEASIFLSTKARCREINDALAGSSFQHGRWSDPKMKLKLAFDLTDQNKAEILNGDYIETKNVRAYMSYPIFKSHAFTSLTLRCPGKFRVGCKEYVYGYNARHCSDFDIIPENQVCKLNDDLIPFVFSDYKRMDLKIEGQVKLDPNYTQMLITKIGWDEI